MKLSPLTAAVVVKDLKAARKFYTQKLGLKVLDDMDHWLTVGADEKGMRLHLCEMKPLEKGNTGILFSVDEKTDKAYAALKKKGVKFTKPPKRQPWGWECVFQDPDGNEFLLMPAR